MSTLRGGQDGGEAGADSGARSVVLRHTLADGSEHLDWMIERTDGSPGAGLITFRLSIGTDLFRAETFQAERIGDHRRDYLMYEGPVSSGRGRVDRVARYRVVDLAADEARLRVVLEQTGGGGRMKWTGEQEIGPHWKFVGVVC